MNDYFAHDTAIIDENCQIGNGTKIWHFTHVMEGSFTDNRVLLNDGHGYFEYADGRIPLRAGAEETTEADLADIDCDGDLDVFFANVRLASITSDPQNRLLVNDGSGFFRDETHGRLPIDTFDTWEAARATSQGASLVLSVNSTNRVAAVDWGVEVVAIPDAPNDVTKTSTPGAI